MEIKGINEIYKVYSPAASGNSTAKFDDTTSNIKSDNNGHDTINISPQGSFQSKISTEVKKYVAAAQTDNQVSQKRIESLKAKYYADNCPVSGTEVASAMLGRVCGLNI